MLVKRREANLAAALKPTEIMKANPLIVVLQINIKPILFISQYISFLILNNNNFPILIK